jgi:hypothetical protein
LDYKDILELAKTELTIDRFNLSEESSRTPNILMRFADIYREEKVIYHRMNKKLNEMIKDKFEYYLGKASEDVYNEKPFDKKVLRQDVDIYIEADPEISSIRFQMSVQKEKLTVLEKYLHSISQREFAISNAIKSIKFDAGEL